MVAKTCLLSITYVVLKVKRNSTLDISVFRPSAEKGLWTKTSTIKFFFKFNTTTLMLNNQVSTSIVKM